jgi:hypothetical protein
MPALGSWQKRTENLCLLLNILDDSDHKFDIPATVCADVAEQYASSASFFILLISVLFFFSVAH